MSEKKEGEGGPIKYRYGVYSAMSRLERLQRMQIKNPPIRRGAGWIAQVKVGGQQTLCVENPTVMEIVFQRYAKEDITPPRQDHGPVSISGWGEKHGSKKLQSWNKRYFELHEHEITYHPDEGQPPKGTIPLYGGLVRANPVEKGDTRSPWACDNARKNPIVKRENGIRISVPSFGRVFYIFFGPGEEGKTLRDEWLAAIRHNIELLLVHPATVNSITEIMRHEKLKPFVVKDESIGKNRNFFAALGKNLLRYRHICQMWFGNEWAGVDKLSVPSGGDGDEKYSEFEKACFHVRNSNVDAMRKILKKDAFEIDCRRPDTGATLLHQAALNDDERMVKLLLKDGADPNIPDAFDTPLIAVSRMGFSSIVKILLSAGAYRWYVNEFNETALGEARYFHHHATVKALQSFGLEFKFRYLDDKVFMCQPLPDIQSMSELKPPQDTAEEWRSTQPRSKGAMNLKTQKTLNRYAVNGKPMGKSNKNTAAKNTKKLGNDELSPEIETEADEVIPDFVKLDTAFVPPSNDVSKKISSSTSMQDLAMLKHSESVEDMKEKEKEEDGDGGEEKKEKEEKKNGLGEESESDEEEDDDEDESDDDEDEKVEMEKKEKNEESEEESEEESDDDDEEEEEDDDDDDEEEEEEEEEKTKVVQKRTESSSSAGMGSEDDDDDDDEDDEDSSPTVELVIEQA